MSGQRPALTEEQIIKALGGNPTQAMIETELTWLDKLGVRVK